MRAIKQHDVFKKLFALSEAETRQLLTILKDAKLGNSKASYWPCTTRLIESSLFKKIELEASRRLKRKLFFVFDELFTPCGDASNPFEQTFQAWHKDIEDENFEDGCWNVWVPLFTSTDEVEGLEIILSDELNEYDLALPAHARSVSPFLKMLPEWDQNSLLFLNKTTMKFKIEKRSNMPVAQPHCELNHVYLLKSNFFHKAVNSRSFQFRFGIKFSLSPFVKVKNGAQDVSTFAMGHRILSERRAQPVRDHRRMHYEVGKYVHEHCATQYNLSDVKSQTLYQSFVENLLRQIKTTPKASR